MTEKTFLFINFSVIAYFSILDFSFFYVKIATPHQKGLPPLEN